MTARARARRKLRKGTFLFALTREPVCDVISNADGDKVEFLFALTREPVCDEAHKAKATKARRPQMFLFALTREPVCDSARRIGPNWSDFCFYSLLRENRSVTPAPEPAPIEGVKFLFALTREPVCDEEGSVMWSDQDTVFLFALTREPVCDTQRTPSILICFGFPFALTREPVCDAVPSGRPATRAVGVSIRSYARTGL